MSIASPENTSPNALEKQTLEKQYVQIKAQLREEQLAAIQAYTTAHPEIKKKAASAMKLLPFSRYDATLSYDENFRTNSYFRAYLVGWIERNYPDAVSSINTSALKRLKKKIDILS